MLTNYTGNISELILRWPRGLSLKLQHIRISFGYSQTRTGAGAEGGESEDAAGIRAVGEEGE